MQLYKVIFLHHHAGILSTDIDPIKEVHFSQRCNSVIAMEREGVSRRAALLVVCFFVDTASN